MTTTAIPAAGDALSRRRLLTAAPVAVAAIALPAALAGSAEAEDPILPVYREWLAAAAEHRATFADEPADYSDEAARGVWQERQDAACLAAHGCANAVAAVTPTTTAGIAAAAHVLWVVGGPVRVRGTGLYLEECEETANKLIAAIWRVGSGLSGNPDSVEGTTA